MSIDLKMPTLGPFEINSQVYPMGDAPMNFLVGCYYVEGNRYLKRAGYLDYALFYSDWRTPGPLDYKYQPDAYKFLIEGIEAVEHTTPYMAIESCFRLIETKGGFDAYLSRLKSKRRSELKKINTLTIDTSSILSDGDLVNTGIDVYLESRFNHHVAVDENKTIDDWFGHGFTTTKAPLLLLLYVGKQIQLGRNLLGSSTLKRVLLPVHDAEGRHVCNTLCISMHNDKFLYAVCDENKSEDYSAKAVTIANIQWAAENGYEYVDIDNGILSEDTVSDDTVMGRVAYKSIFFTGYAEIPCYFNDENSKANAIEEAPEFYKEPSEILDRL